MKVIGITGGIGSGKSYVAHLAAEAFDMLHIDTDSISKRQMKKGGSVYNSVVDAFGTEILLADGEVDRAKLGQLVFEDKEKLALLNSLTHPAVNSTVDALIESAEDVFEGVIIETAILKEAGYEDKCDAIWYVYAPEEERITRLMASRGFSREKAEQVMKSQAKDEAYRAYASSVIDNSSAKTDEELISALRELLI